ncbi:helix-turn-helix domain-containing protein [Ravibacter arvi]|uniref:Helix-turn-helix domain-containing protein n=1 Tax=Ravibacter arvi TaxID=2051041 RepID=A0ABP8LRT2_9BACT
MEQNFQLELAREFVFYTNKSVFLTGKAGTGKTTFLTQLRRSLPKRMAVVAPTGVAAINAGGVTIHSLFQLPFGPNIPGSEASGTFRFGREKINLIKSIDLLVIDEVSMVRADLLDGIDSVLRRFKDRNRPFGGTQLLLIGDLQQLAPVIKDDEWNLLKPHYDSVFFFSSKALQQLDLVRIELTHIYRQTDQAFINVLNQVRDNQLDQGGLELLNSRFVPSFSPKRGEGYIILTTHNASAGKINTGHLEEISEESFFFDARVTDDFPAYSYPTDETLELKIGAQVMFVKNDSAKERRYFNGKIGEVVSIADDAILVKCPGDTMEIVVEKATWSNLRYQLNPETMEVEEKIVGTFTQFPLKLAWAITIHKSQGLTFERAVIDANLSFAHGQVYVALSRCKTLEGMVLSSPIEAHSIRSDRQVASFSEETTANPPNAGQLQEAKAAYQKNTLFEAFDWHAVQRSLGQIGKIYREFQVTDDSLKERLKLLTDAFDRDILMVASRFRNQLNHLLAASGNAVDASIQERLGKAAGYFQEKMSTAIRPEIDSLKPESENKALQKAFLKAQEELERNLFVKSACLEAVGKDFSVAGFLKARSRAEHDFVFQGEKDRDIDPQKPLSNSDLYKALKSWRDEVAADHGVPAYMVIQVKTMTEIARSLPVSLKALEGIKGIGKSKVNRFGVEIVSIVRSYCTEKGISPSPQMLIDEPPAPKVPSRETTLSLFREGKSIEEIAAGRSLAVSTVESHLSHYIASGDVQVEEVFSKERIALILEFVGEKPVNSLTEIKAGLGDDFTFSEIRAAVSLLKTRHAE